MFARCLAIILFSLTLLSCQQPENYVRLNGYTMGTTYQITIEKKSINASSLKAQIDARLVTINQLMSTYIDDSELSLFNSKQSTECLPLSAETLYVINNANQVSLLSNGKFDVTLAPLIEIWGFDKKDTHEQIPDSDTITQLLQQIGFKKLTIKNNCVQKTSPQLSVNLSAIAKGYGVDQIAKILVEHQIQNYLVEIGGEIANKGVNAKGLPWHIAIESASTEERSVQRIITPKGLGIATSGDYRNYFEKDGKRFSHTIDPTTGFPITHNLASITVLHSETMLADALATAMMVMGADASLAFAEQHNIPVFMLVKTEAGFEEVFNPLMQQYLP